MIRTINRIAIDPQRAADAFGIYVPDYQSLDGRVMTTIVGLKLIRKGWRRIENKSGFLLKDREGKVFKLRALGERSVNLEPSKHKGCGRMPDEQERLEDNARLDGFYIFDCYKLLNYGEGRVWELTPTPKAANIPREYFPGSHFPGCAVQEDFFAKE